MDGIEMLKVRECRRRCVGVDVALRWKAGGALTRRDFDRGNVGGDGDDLGDALGDALGDGGERVSFIWSQVNIWFGRCVNW